MTPTNILTGTEDSEYTLQDIRIVTSDLIQFQLLRHINILIIHCLNHNFIFSVISSIFQHIFTFLDRINFIHF